MGVLSNLITPYIIRAIEGYLKPECIDNDTLRLGIWNGYVELSDVCLKEDIIDSLGLPFALRHAR